MRVGAGGLEHDSFARGVACDYQLVDLTRLVLRGPLRRNVAVCVHNDPFVFGAEPTKGEEGKLDLEFPVFAGSSGPG